MYVLGIVGKHGMIFEVSRGHNPRPLARKATEAESCGFDLNITKMVPEEISLHNLQDDAETFGLSTLDRKRKGQKGA